ncbi:DDE-type integrase/transposase/recombinase [Cognatiyoonia sp. IB215182]|uniref:DDE-type integrase/transposase/recombinase n=1 Tax=Cognatiyoonia sp. IB215182 TaxID=3097353 RepID=UPI0039B733F5
MIGCLYELVSGWPEGTRVGGKWRYLWRSGDAGGQMIDFRLTARRDANAATVFLNKAIGHVLA